ncbi:AMP-dependent synthetase and ligase [Leptospira ryugenii]|uniref:AMP-dependent synthetase and ligase n=1 Tax=Leptospira ryugenii TaxID=1917863 RepID=A0A2P2E0E3_9LEPT|nr:long-chain fatty acid--CoA ligase [Leptospira ryugenii]GBF50355.1 AMP-dependent synthetase and ligase [Leptospira ryugenii]
MSKTLVNLLDTAFLQWQNLPAFAYKLEKSYQFISFQQLKQKAEYLACALIHLGLERGDRVALVSDNRWEWIITSLGINYAGGVDVPRGSDATDEDLKYIIAHSESKFVFVENAQMRERIVRMRTELPNCIEVFLLDGSYQFPNLGTLLGEGEILQKRDADALRDRISEIQSNDLVTIIYTSGTTGNPKGVMLSHANFVSQIENVPIHLHSGERILSILPVWHIFERIFEYMSLAKGACTYYSNVKTLREDLKSVKPTFMASAPRLWESLFHAIHTQVNKGTRFQKQFFSFAINVAKYHKLALLYALNRIDGVEISKLKYPSLLRPLYLLFAVLSYPAYQLFNQLVFKKIKSILGGHLKTSVSGGGSLPFYIDLFFSWIGVSVLEGYGMTETSPIIAMRKDSSSAPGTVGVAFPNTEIKLVDPETKQTIRKAYQKGEILVKGPQLMKGYLKGPEKTSQVIVDNWLHTGDLGMYTFRKELKLVGRIKETIVLLGGENVEPVPIEVKILESSAIEQCMVVGQDKKYLTALVLPRLEYFKEYGQSWSDLKENREVYEILKKEIQSRNGQSQGFKSFERVVDFHLLDMPFGVGEELTAKLSLKRNFILEKYSQAIEAMYRK